LTATGTSILFGGILTVSVGHCNPKITSKVNAQVNRLQHTSTLYPNEHIVALAEKIAQITPGNLQQSFFTNSGTEANEAAILLARMSTGSHDVVALRHAYSGGSALAKAVTAHAPYRKGGVISVGVSHARDPYCYRCPLHLKYPDCEVACAEDVGKPHSDRDQRKHRCVHGRTNSRRRRIHYSAEGVLQDCLQDREEYGALFIADEVQTAGTHRKEMVRHRELGSHSGHDHQRERHGQWRADRLDRDHAEIAAASKE